MNQKIGYSKMCYQQAKYIDIWFEVSVLSKECTQWNEESHKKGKGANFTWFFLLQERIVTLARIAR